MQLTNKMLASAGFVALGIVVPFFMMDLYEPVRTFQGVANLNAMRSQDLISAIAQYPKTWPPLYPLVLWCVHALGDVSAHLVNVALWSASLLLVLLFCRQYISRKYCLIPVLILAINNAIYYNAGYQSSEFLMIALALLLLLQLAKHLERPAITGAIGLGLLTGAIGLTRYFGLLWLFPTTAVCLLLVQASNLDKCKHLIAYGAAAFLSFAPWVLYVRMSTGYLTGMDRTGEREIPAGVGSFTDAIAFSDNVTRTLETMTYDLFLPQFVATPMLLLFSEPGFFGLAMGALVLFVLLCIVVQGGKLLFGLWAPTAAQPGHLPALFAASYIVVLIGVWTMGNNDPIFSRFVFPAYPFLVLSACAAFFHCFAKTLAQSIVRYTLLLTGTVYLGSMLVEVSRLSAELAR